MSPLDCFQDFGMSFNTCCIFVQWSLMGMFCSICSLMMSRVGIEIPTIEVRFEHLNIGAEAYVGSRGLPTVLNFTYNILEVNLFINIHLGLCNLLHFQKFKSGNSSSIFEGALEHSPYSSNSKETHINPSQCERNHQASKVRKVFWSISKLVFAWLCLCYLF